MPWSIMSAASSGSLFKSSLDDIEDLIYGVGQSLSDFLCGDLDVLRQTVHEVASLDIHRALALVGICGAYLYLDILGSSLADEQVIFLLDIVDYGLIEVVARDSCGV